MPKPEAPVDPLTQFPLPFVPLDSLPPVPQPGDFSYNPEVADFHHPVFERNAVEGFGPGGAAARDSRLQWVWRSQHVRFHREWGGLAEHMPDTPVKQYRSVVFGVAGYVPEEGISFLQRTPRVVTLSHRQREQLRHSGQLIIGNSGVRIRRFLLDYSLQNGLPAINPNLIDEFLDLSTSYRRTDRVQALTDVLLQQAIDPIVTPGIKQIYEYTKRHHMLRPGIPRALGSLIRQEILSGFSRAGFARVLAKRFAELRTMPSVHPA